MLLYASTSVWILSAIASVFGLKPIVTGSMLGFFNVSSNALLIENVFEYNKGSVQTDKNPQFSNSNIFKLFAQQAFSTEEEE